nr:hypothetical protein REQ54_04282 [Rhizobium sp. Q54]
MSRTILPKRAAEHGLVATKRRERQLQLISLQYIRTLKVLLSTKLEREQLKDSPLELLPDEGLILEVPS